MRDAAGELAEALQALGALLADLVHLPVRLGAQPLLLGAGGDALGDVADAGERDDALVGAQDAAGDVDRDERAVAVAGGRAGQPSAVGALGQQPPHRHVQQVVAGVAEQPLRLAVDQHDPAALVDADERVGRRRR